MNEELKKDIEDLAQAQRLKDEESLYADNVVAAFKYGEEIEEKVRYIKKLEKRIRLFWGILGLGILAVLLVITYSIYSFVFSKKELQPNENVTVQEVTVAPEPIALTKSSEKTILYSLEPPKLSLAGINTTTLSNLRDSVDEGEIGEHELYYLDGYYTSKMGDCQFDDSTVVYSVADITTKLSKLQRSYIMTECDNQSFTDSVIVVKQVPMVCGINYADERGLELYYNTECLDYLKNKGYIGDDYVLGHQYITFEVTVFDKSSIPKIESVIEKVLEQQKYSMYANDLSNNLPNDFKIDIFNAIIEAVPKVAISESEYCYYEDVFEECGAYSGVVNGVAEQLSDIVTLNIVIDEIICDLYGYLYYAK